MNARAVGPLLVAAAFAFGAPACRRTPGAPPPFTAPVTLGGRNVAPRSLENGRDVYTHFCRPCHGDAGDGKGPAAAGLRPPPRDLRLGVYKFAAVAAGQLPRDTDFVRTLRHGLHGTAMLAWDVPAAELDDLIQYVKAFAPRWQKERPGESGAKASRRVWGVMQSAPRPPQSQLRGSLGRHAAFPAPSASWNPHR